MPPFYSITAENILAFPLVCNLLSTETPSPSPLFSPCLIVNCSLHAL